MCLPKPSPKDITYRDYKHFDAKVFENDLLRTPLHVADIFDDPGDQLWCLQSLTNETLDLHAPLKTKKVHAKQPPFMNAELRKAAAVKARLWNKYKSSKTPRNWELFRRERNKVTSLRRKSIAQYFRERCDGGPSNKSFFKTIKPFISNKAHVNSDIMLETEGTVISDQQQVSDHMNDFFAN